MDKTITRSYCFDGDICDVLFRFDESCGKYLGDYPDFEESPRYTQSGKMWITAMQNACPCAQNKFSDSEACEDCGSCIFFSKEKQGDLVGICEHESNRKKTIA